ncbi:MAG: hypothetical protein H0X13_12395 [Ramlibacter sp.]|nr:hypothetical protein [Ramlibacter sp.]
MSKFRHLSRAVAVAGLAFSAALPALAQTDDSVLPARAVTFVCSYGSVKSLMAASRFNFLAEKRGIPERAVSRAASDATVHTSVPDPIVKALATEGFKVADYRPRTLTQSEARTAVKIVYIPLEDPTQEPKFQASPTQAVERWEGIPSALRDYDTVKRMLYSRIDTLVDDLAKGHGK